MKIKNMLAFWLLGSPHRPQKTRAEIEQVEKYALKNAEELINHFASDHEKEPDWKRIALFLAFELLKEKDKNVVHKIEASNLRREVYEKIKQDSKRIENRPDQINKRAFQEAVKFNIDCYETKADAIKDLKEKPQFSGRSEKILREWMSPDVWTKPTKPGRPKKK